MSRTCEYRLDEKSSCTRAAAVVVDYDRGSNKAGWKYIESWAFCAEHYAAQEETFTNEPGWRMSGVALLETQEEGTHIYTHSDTKQNSVEVGQTAKGLWYIKSIKVYVDDGSALERIKELRQQAEEAIND